MVNPKITYLQKLVDRFDKEDTNSGMLDEAESKVSTVLGALDSDQLQITRRINFGGEIKLQKFYVKA